MMVLPVSRRCGLDGDAVEGILSALEPYPYGWRRELPAPYHFFGQPITATIETRPFPEDALAPLPTLAEINLLRVVLARFSDVLTTAEREYAASNVDCPQLSGKVHQTRVWVCREFQEREGPDRWALTSGISDAPDWTIFIEFRELTFLEVWSGD